jgi:hypothetical protein
MKRTAKLWGIYPKDFDMGMSGYKAFKNHQKFHLPVS